MPGHHPKETIGSKAQDQTVPNPTLSYSSLLCAGFDHPIGKGFNRTLKILDFQDFVRAPQHPLAIDHKKPGARAGLFATRERTYCYHSLRSAWVQ
jgi:hypothetical protein